MKGLANRVVLVRGGGKDRSMGYGIARAFAAAGSDLVLVGASRRKLSEARELASQHGVEVLSFQDAFEDEGFAQRVVRETVDRFGRLDVLVNAALVAKPAFIDELDAADLRECLDLNLVAPFSWMRACQPHLARSAGLVINLGSESASAGMPACGALAAASTGLSALARVAAREWEPEGVRVEHLTACASTAQADAWAREFPEASEEAMRDATLVTIDEVGERCVALAREHLGICL